MANFSLGEIIAIRQSTEYQRADQLRRRVGAKNMASCSQETNEYQAIRLLIGTWNNIAAAVRANALDQDVLFQITPVGLAWETVKPAVEVLRRSVGQDYASEFEELALQYEKWLGTSSGERFRSRSQQAGLTMFSQEQQ